MVGKYNEPVMPSGAALGRTRRPHQLTTETPYELRLGEARDVRKIRRWFFDDHRDREWIGRKLPQRSERWIRDVVYYRIHGAVE